MPDNPLRTLPYTEIYTGQDLPYASASAGPQERHSIFDKQHPAGQRFLRQA